MNLNSEQKKFAYGKYVFYDKIKSILDFMDPVSNLDVKVEEVKSKTNSFKFFILLIFIITGILVSHYYKNLLAEYFKIDPTIITPAAIAISVIILVFYGLYYWKHINLDVDNDLNNFIIPFLQKVEKYINKNTSIKLITNLSSKLDKKNKVDSGTYADNLVLPWFSAELPLENNIKVFIDLTYIINCFGKLEAIHSGEAFKSLKMKAELRFVFPKRPSFEKFDYIGANYVLDWNETDKEYSLSIKTIQDCSVEFYRDIDKKLGLIFDNNFCNDIIDDVFARITGFTGYLIFDNSNLNEEEYEESDYEELQKQKESNEKFYENDLSEQQTKVINDSINEVNQETSDLQKMIEKKEEEIKKEQENNDSYKANNSEYK